MIEGNPVGRRRWLCTRLSPNCEWIDYRAPFHTAKGIYQLADKAHLDVQKCVSAAR
jgi:hypothetical protein